MLKIEISWFVYSNNEIRDLSATYRMLLTVSRDDAVLQYAIPKEKMNLFQQMTFSRLKWMKHKQDKYYFLKSKHICQLRNHFHVQCLPERCTFCS